MYVSFYELLTVKVSTVKAVSSLIDRYGRVILPLLLKRGQLVDAKLSQYVVSNNERYAMFEQVTFVPVST